MLSYTKWEKKYPHESWRHSTVRYRQIDVVVSYSYNFLVLRSTNSKLIIADIYYTRPSGPYDFFSRYLKKRASFWYWSCMHAINFEATDGWCYRLLVAGLKERHREKIKAIFCIVSFRGARKENSSCWGERGLSTVGGDMINRKGPAMRLIRICQIATESCMHACSRSLRYPGKDKWSS